MLVILIFVCIIFQGDPFISESKSGGHVSDDNVKETLDVSGCQIPWNILSFGGL